MEKIIKEMIKLRQQNGNSDRPENIQGFRDLEQRNSAKDAKQG